MDRSLLVTILKCPLCGLDFVQRQDALLCGNDHSFTYQRNVIDFSTAEEINDVQKRSQESFQVEWTKYYKNLGWSLDELIDVMDSFLRCTKAMPNFFFDKIVVDAGCGNGRYINALNKLTTYPPKLIIGIELSDAVYVAAENCSTLDNVLFLKMDLNSLPKILKKPIDYIYTIGVLHHTPNAERSFYNLAECLKQDGFLSVYLYGKGNPILFRVNNFLRNRFFQKWPHKFVYYLCVLIAIPSQVFRIKFLGPWMLDFIDRFIFISPDVHNMFDAYTAGYTSFHDRKEVEQWYHSAGFDCVVESQLNHTDLYCIGRRIKAL